MDQINPLEGIVENKEIAGEVYIRVTPENDKKIIYNSLIKNLETHEVTNFDKNRIREVIRLASGDYESIGPLLELYKEEYDSYLLTKVTPLTATLMVKELQRMRVTKTLLMYKLKKSGITYGIDEVQIDNIIKNRLLDQDFIIATGTEPVKGDDGNIEYAVKIESDLTPEELEDGSVDFRSVKSFTMVTAGDLVARRVPPTLGVDGTSVTGDKIIAEPGKEYQLRSAENVSVTPDNDNLIADKSGVILQDKNGTIFVRDVLEIKGDVDFEVGNINFPGKVLINGDVLPGFIIESESDILVHGQVEASTIKSTGGTVQIEKGIIGKNSALIYAKEQININFAQDCKLVSDNIVSVSDSLLHCEVECNEFITLSEGTTVIGGIIVAFKSIHLANCGNDDGMKTEVTLVDKVTNEYIEKRKQLVIAKEKVDRLYIAADREWRNKKKMANSAGMIMNEQLEKNLENLEKKFLSVKQKCELIEKSIASIDEALKDPVSDDGYIEITGDIKSGTKIKLYKYQELISNNTKAKKYLVKDYELITKDISK